MPDILLDAGPVINTAPPPAIKSRRLVPIDFLRGTVMIIMAIDHVRGYFHKSAFLFSPTDLAQTSVPLFFTRWITHYCAPIFVFLAGIAAWLYGAKRSRAQLSFFLFTRGLWLVFAELFIVTLGWSFNLSYHFFNLQVIWAIGISMLVLSIMVYINQRVVLFTGLLLIAAHNLLDTVHVPGTSMSSVLWAILHDPGDFVIGQVSLFVHYPVLPWIGILATGFCVGSLYAADYNAAKRKKIFLIGGFVAIAVFIFLRLFNLYGDASHWSVQKNNIFSVLSFLNLTKYPPSLLYILMTLGPTLIFLAFTENVTGGWVEKNSIFGRVPMFYYILHIFIIHLLAVAGAVVCGYKWTSMVLLTNRVNRVPELKGYGFSLVTVYLVWLIVIIILFPLCKWFDKFKRSHQSQYWWLSYL